VTAKKRVKQGTNTSSANLPRLAVAAARGNTRDRLVRTISLKRAELGISISFGICEWSIGYLRRFTDERELRIWVIFSSELSGSLTSPTQRQSERKSIWAPPDSGCWAHSPLSAYRRRLPYRPRVFEHFKPLP